MKKYILKLIDADIKVIEHRLYHMNKRLPDTKDLEYANRQIRAQNNNLNKAIHYRERIEKTL